MSKSHNTVRFVCVGVALGFVCLFAACSSALAQAPPSTTVTVPDGERGVELYQQGDDAGAIAALRRAVKQDSYNQSAWHFLGLALGRQGKPSDARKAHEKAAKIGEEFLFNRYDSVSINPTPEQQAQLKMLLEQSAESADEYLRLTSKPSKKKVSEWQARAVFLREFKWMAEHNTGVAPNRIYAPQEVTTKARILNRQEPQYTEDARTYQIAGTVVIKAVVDLDGRVKAIRPVAGLPYGLTMKAVAAARATRFSPATLNGVRVAQFIQIEYNFNLY
jgi:TonB family protein